MTIPAVAHGENVFWERIDSAKRVTRNVSGRLLQFFVQPTRHGCIHACTIDDLNRLLSYVPAQDWDGIEAIVLRQPRRKEQSIAPVWAGWRTRRTS